MKSRCELPSTVEYKYYGGRGIRIEFESFGDFLAHVGERPPGMTIDRINPNGNYAPGNVRWADAVTQRRNHRIPPKLKAADIPRLIAARDAGAKWPAIARQFGVCPGTAWGYYRRYKPSE